ncbi:MAG: phosphoenolpyruvate carboxylase [Candidatus Heimdallarchaeota archaeon]
MSTQHPDNVRLPFFAESPDLGGDDEIQEAFYAYSHLKCDEQMWDAEGKEVDGFVVKKLLTKFPDFFADNRLGKDIFLTIRVPNPKVEKAEAKVLIETLESIPRSFDAANLYFKDDIAPIFEVILPMTSSEQGLDRIYNYYHKFVVGKQFYPTIEGDILISDWVGEFKPHNINVIPLVEDKQHMLFSHLLLKAYLNDKDFEYQRIFFARSDPALNYGLVSAVLINKIAHQRIHQLEEEISVDLYPIIGVGSAPFRGNLRPDTVERVIKEYPSVQTFTLQSAFKYDYPPDVVSKAISQLCETPRSRPHYMEEERCLEIVERYSEEYRKHVMKLAPMVNKIAKFVPKRRKRKLHIGLFGYGRTLGEHHLPRAIGFTASLCSMGLPPALLGLNALSQKDYDFILTQYINFEEDLRDSLKYFNPEQPFVPKSVIIKLKELAIDYETNEEHKKVTDYIIDSLRHNKTEDLSVKILMAANQRRYLG